MTRFRMGAPVTAPQDAPGRGSKPAPSTPGEPVLKPNRTTGFPAVEGKPAVYGGRGCHRCADCYETFDEPEERERRQDTFFRPDSLAAKLDAAEPDDLVTDGGVDRRRRIAIRGNPVWMDTPAGYEEWIDLASVDVRPRRRVY